MPFRTRLLRLKAPLRQAFNRIAAAFQPEVRLSGWEPQVGPPPWRELLYGFTAAGGALIGAESSRDERKPAHPEIRWVTVRPRAARRAQIQAALAAIHADDTDSCAVRAMRERYWLASTSFRLLTREAQN
jgi:hypothetical protein